MLPVLTDFARRIQIRWQAHRLSGAALGCAALCVATHAFAGPKDQEVQQLAEQAIFTDYLGTNFEAAKQKLQRAAELCAPAAACSPGVAAKVHRDLGVVLIAGLGDLAAGRQEFVRALQVDPSVTLDPDLATEQVVEAFEEARATAGSAAPRAEPAPTPQQEAAIPAEPAPVEPAKTQGAPPATPEPSPNDQASALGNADAQMTASLDAEVCPPDFPGCDDKSGGGAYCESDLECSGDRLCVNNECTESSTPAGSAKNWVSVALQQDFLLLGDADRSLCASDDYSCFNVAGEPVTGETGGFKGGIVMATTRFLLGFDRVLMPNLTVGLRAGFAIRGAPEDFVPFHAEARAAYWLGADPFGRPGFRPYGFLGAGIGEVDATMPVKDGTGATHDAWRQAGLNFVAIGPGVVFAVERGFGISAEGKVQVLFPSSALGGALQFGATLGF